MEQWCYDDDWQEIGGAEVVKSHGRVFGSLRSCATEHCLLNHLSLLSFFCDRAILPSNANSKIDRHPILSGERPLAKLPIPHPQVLMQFQHSARLLALS